MSTFAVPIRRILALEPHPNADTLEVAVVDGFRSIVKKGQFLAGEFAAYIPEFALLPEWLLKSMNFWNPESGKGTLYGSRGNRTKTIRLRGQISQGLCVPVAEDSAGVIALRTGADPGCFAFVKEGDDVSRLMGIEKYEPVVPSSMTGEVYRAGQEFTMFFDIENWKRYPYVLQEGEDVVFTEKLHGSCTLVVVLPYDKTFPQAHGKRKNILISSKRVGSNGLAFQDVPENKDNVYIRSAQKLIEQIDALQEMDDVGLSEPLILFGETFGVGVQDLVYGAKAPTLRMFAAARGYRGRHVFQNWDVLEKELAPCYGFDLVPLLYRGPWSKEVMLAHTDGNTLLNAEHMREGIIMTPTTERWDPALGRVSLKSVSEAYLLRNGGTEFS